MTFRQNMEASKPRLSQLIFSVSFYTFSNQCFVSLCTGHSFIKFDYHKESKVEKWNAPNLK